MVPGMGDKISVLMGFSLIQKIAVQKMVAALFTKNTFFFKQDSLALYLKKYLKSSQYMGRQGQQKTKRVPEHGSFLAASVGEIQ
jgi:hypothetical protein